MFKFTLGNNLNMGFIIMHQLKFICIAIIQLIIYLQCIFCVISTLDQLHPQANAILQIL